LEAAREKETNVPKRVVSSSKEANVKIALKARSDYATKWEARSEEREMYAFRSGERGIILKSTKAVLLF
jgi:hypothetical protein